MKRIQWFISIIWEITCIDRETINEGLNVNMPLPLIDRVLKVKINNMFRKAVWSRYSPDLGDLVSFSSPIFPKCSGHVLHIMRDEYTIIRSDQRYWFQHGYEIGFGSLGKP